MTDILSSTPSDGVEFRDWKEPWLLAGPREPDHFPVLPGSLTHSVRNIQQEVRADLASRGLSARSRDLHDDRSIRAAEHLIQLAPSLYREVLRLVDGLFILDIPDPCYDQGHSEPAYAGMIFVSLPPTDEIGSLRLAEGIVHEAMHLNLSELEHGSSFNAGEVRLYSPWRQEERPASGVLHGAYVFACLRRFFQIVFPSLNNPLAMHAIKRQKEIREEAAEVDWASLSEHLTPTGTALLKKIRRACAS